jgi:hypothetical protein
LVRQSLDSTAQNEPLQTGETQKLIDRAIVEGEAYALDFKNTIGMFFSGFKNLATDFLGPQSDIRERLAQSFGGAPSDVFIAAREAGIHRRVIAALLPPRPRRGFDALVEALRKALPAAAARGENGRTNVARLLRASADDQVVRNLVARIVALDSIEKDPR